MKKKVLLSSALTIALCLCLIAGSTFALFTSQSEVDISVTAAEVNMKASIANLKLFSVKAGTNKDAPTVTDENGASYYYVDRTSYKMFTNTGTAYFEGRELTIDRITPGDKVAFEITGTNTSDVAILHRFIIEYDAEKAAKEGVDAETLMKGLVVYVGGEAYPFYGLKSYVSPWTRLDVGENMTNVPVTIELPVKAGNVYQKTVTFIKVTVEAVQSNASVETTTSSRVKFFDGAYDYAGRVAFAETIINDEGNVVTLNNAILDVNTYSLQAAGSLTLNNVTIEAGNAGNYAVIAKGENAKVELNNVSIPTSAGGAIGVNSGAEMVVNGGNAYVDTSASAGRYVFYVAGEGSVLTINGGNFSFKLPQKNSRRAFIYAYAGTTVYITGGNFYGATSTKDDYKAGIMGEGTVIITGGVFCFDPSKWVADGYHALKNGSNWYVLPENVDVVVKNAAELQSALDAATGDYGIYVIGDIAGDVTAVQKDGVSITVNGNGNQFAGVFYVNGQSQKHEDVVAALTINNFNFVGANAATLGNDAFVSLGLKSNVNATRYAQNVTVNNCTFTAETNDIVAVKDYTAGTVNLTINNCVVEGAHSLLQTKGVAGDKGLVIFGCKVNAKNGIHTGTSDLVAISDCNVNVEGYAVRFGESGAMNAEEKTYTIDDSTLKAACTDGDAVIMFRGNGRNATLTLTNVTLEGAVEYAGVVDGYTDIVIG